MNNNYDDKEYKNYMNEQEKKLNQNLNEDFKKINRALKDAENMENEIIQNKGKLKKDWKDNAVSLGEQLARGLNDEERQEYLNTVKESIQNYFEIKESDQKELERINENLNKLLGGN